MAMKKFEGGLAVFVLAILWLSGEGWTADDTKKLNNTMAQKTLVTKERLPASLVAKPVTKSAPKAAIRTNPKSDTRSNRFQPAIVRSNKPIEKVRFGTASSKEGRDERRYKSDDSRTSGSSEKEGSDKETDKDKKEETNKASDDAQIAENRTEGMVRALPSADHVATVANALPPMDHVAEVDNPLPDPDSVANPDRGKYASWLSDKNAKAPADQDQPYTRALLHDTEYVRSLGVERMKEITDKARAETAATGVGADPRITAGKGMTSEEILKGAALAQDLEEKLGVKDSLVKDSKFWDNYSQLERGKIDANTFLNNMGTDTSGIPASDSTTTDSNNQNSPGKQTGSTNTNNPGISRGGGNDPLGAKSDSVRSGDSSTKKGGGGSGVIPSGTSSSGNADGGGIIPFNPGDASYTTNNITQNDDGTTTVGYTRAGGNDGKDGQYYNVYGSEGTYDQYDANDNYIGTFSGTPPKDGTVGQTSNNVQGTDVIYPDSQSGQSNDQDNSQDNTNDNQSDNQDNTQDSTNNNDNNSNENKDSNSSGSDSTDSTDSTDSSDSTDSTDTTAKDDTSGDDNSGSDDSETPVPDGIADTGSGGGAHANRVLSAEAWVEKREARKRQVSLDNDANGGGAQHGVDSLQGLDRQAVTEDMTKKKTDPYSQPTRDDTPGGEAGGKDLGKNPAKPGGPDEGWAGPSGGKGPKVVGSGIPSQGAKPGGTKYSGLSVGEGQVGEGQTSEGQTTGDSL